MATRPPIVALGLLLSLTPCGFAFADEAESAAVGAARELGYEGLQAYKAGDYEVALDKLSRAYAVVKVPSLGLWTARALVKNRRLVEAAEIYLAITRLPLQRGDIELQKEAQASAANERDALLPQLPKLIIRVEGAGRTELEVLVDGAVMQTELIGASRPTDPGTHEIVVRRGADEQRRSTTLDEGQTETVEFVFTKAAATDPKPAPARTESVPSAVGQGSSESWFREQQRTLSWVAFGVGGAGVATGIVTALMAQSERKKLESSDACIDGVCYDPEHDRVDKYDTLKLASTIGFVVGAVGAAAGTGLLLTASDETAESGGASVSPWIGVGNAGVAGRF